LTISKADVGPNERDAQIAIGLAFGLSREETGRRVCTSEFPSGVTERTVYNRVKTNGKFIDDVIKFVRSLRDERETEIKQLDKKSVRAELETLLGSAVGTLRKALTEGDVKAAIEVLDRNLGKATQVHKHEGDVLVNHTVTIRQIIDQSQDALESQRLLGSLPAEVLEAEIVEAS
jgi:hypothetical protein